MNTSSRPGRALAAAAVAIAAAAFVPTLLPGGAASAAAALKIATVSPDGSVWMKLLRAAAKEVERETAGRVKLKLYPGGVMGDERAMMRKMRVGQLQGAVLTTGVFNRIYPDVQLYNLPMQFRGLDEVDHVRERLDAELMRGLEASGFVSLGFAEVGMAYAMSTRPARSVRDAAGLKVWTPLGNEAAVKAMRDFGISPIPLTITDVLAGLQTGLIDTVAVPPVGALALQWHGPLEYILDLPFMYVYAPMVLAKRPFGRLDEPDRGAVRRVLGRAVEDADARNRADHDEVWRVLQQQGLSLVRPSAEEAAEWQARADAASRKWVADGIVSQALHERFASYLAEFRASGAE